MNLTLHNVSAHYGGRAALDGVSLSFEPGRITGLIGPNGAGKTTLLRVALGFLPASSGEVRLLDHPLCEWPDDARARAIAYLPQSAESHWPLKAHRLVALGRMPHRAGFAPLTANDMAVVNEALARCDATALAGRRMDELSAGEKARVLLARALATAAPVLLVDEPAAHLDPAHQLQLMELLREEAARGTAVAVTLHDLPLASRFCDELVVLSKGRVAGQGASGAALSDATLAEVFGVSAMRNEDAVIPWRRL
ncbi:MAG TPA: ABC transporter ATP-binding protein [Rhizomicrobium sp.]|nr:ABC transporter ATP-binding protein [Rhizomicrobium sp.]